jgi:hypothetical protein
MVFISLESIVLGNEPRLQVARLKEPLIRPSEFPRGVKDVAEKVFDSVVIWADHAQE